MARYVALLRGVNVGGRKVVMAELRAAAEAAGLTDVRTYVQSGNVVFATRAKPATAARTLHGAIEVASGLDVALTLRTAAEMHEVVERNPYPEVTDGTKLHVMFLDAPPAVPIDLDPARFAPERFSVDGRHVYLSLPNGMSGGELATALMKQKALRTATTRNWNTVVALTEMAGG